MESVIYSLHFILSQSRAPSRVYAQQLQQVTSLCDPGARVLLICNSDLGCKQVRQEEEEGRGGAWRDEYEIVGRELRQDV